MASAAGSWKATRGPPPAGAASDADAGATSDAGAGAGPSAKEDGAGLVDGMTDMTGVASGPVLLARALADGGGEPLRDPTDLVSERTGLAGGGGEASMASGWHAGGCSLAEGRRC